jgi:hypothetical protein
MNQSCTANALSDTVDHDYGIPPPISSLNATIHVLGATFAQENQYCTIHWLHIQFVSKKHLPVEAGIASYNHR